MGKHWQIGLINAIAHIIYLHTYPWQYLFQFLIISFTNQIERENQIIKILPLSYQQTVAYIVSPHIRRYSARRSVSYSVPTLQVQILNGLIHRTESTKDMKEILTCMIGKMLIASLPQKTVARSKHLWWRIKFTGSCINTHHLFTFFTFAITQFSQSFRFLAERAS